MTNSQVAQAPNTVVDGLAILFVTLFAFPIIGQAVPVVNALPGDLTTYVMLAVIPLFFAGFLWGFRWNDFNLIQKALLIYCLYYVGVFTIKFALFGIGADHAGLQLFRERTLGLWFALALFFLYAAIGGSVQRARFLTRFAQGVAFVFLLQLALSLTEDITGNVFQRTQDVLTSGFEQRDILSGVGSGGIQRFGLHFALNGLVREFDAYGIQLIFYNLLFLTQLARRVQWPYVLLCVCAFGAVFLNTTKTGIITIALSDVVFLATWQGRFRAFRLMSAVGGVAILLTLYSSDLLKTILHTGMGEATIYIRLEIWDSLRAWYVKNVFAEPWNLPFGFSFQTLLNSTSSVLDTWSSSTQSELILQLFSVGAAGLVLFLNALFVAPLASYRKVSDRERIVCWLLPASLLLASATMDLQTTYYVFPLIAFIVLYLGSPREERHSPDRRGQAASRGVAARNARTAQVFSKSINGAR